LNSTGPSAALSALLLAAAGLLFCAAGSAAGADKKDPGADLKALRGRIDTLQKEMSSAEGSKNEAADALRNSERAISEANRKLRDLGDQQREVGARLTDLQGQSKRTASDIGSQQEQLARLLYRQYSGLQPDAARLALNGDDPNRVARDLVYLGYLSRAYAALIASLRGNLQHLDALARDTRHESDALAQLRDEEQSQRKQLEAEQREHQQVLARVSKQIEEQRKQLSTLKRNEERLSQLVDRITRELRSRPETLRNERLPDGALGGTPFAQLKGRLSLPVRGELRNRFGSPREDSGLSWKGLFIAAPSGQDVKAVATGRVVFSDWLRGFGNLLILDHGGGYMSLYGNNETVYKQAGDTVKAGETVAQVGNSGGNGDSGLYFEMRRQGKPFDPLPWVNLK